MSKIQQAQERFDSNPDNILFRFSFAQALFDNGQIEAALPHLEQCALSRDDWMIPRILLGKGLVQLHQIDQAKDWLEDAHRLAVEQNHLDPAQEIREILQDL